MLLKISFALLLIVLLIVCIVGARNFTRMDKAMRVFFTLILIVFVTEAISFTLYVQGMSRNTLSHIFSGVELILVGAYFFHCLPLRKKRFSIIVFSLFALALAIGNYIFFQEKRYNSNMLMAESFIIISMALIVFFNFLKNDDLSDMVNNPHFRIWVGLLTLWSSTFFFWAFLLYLQKLHPTYLTWIYLIQVALNILIYGLFGYTFYKLSKKNNNPAIEKDMTTN
ncbi:MAG TPA: hypothetical protein PL009_00950 [Flavipsychrobacter sp.]|nr:hypothetical protein [Flavipsychrobacter sp.]